MLAKTCPYLVWSCSLLQCWIVRHHLIQHWMKFCVHHYWNNTYHCFLYIIIHCDYLFNFILGILPELLFNSLFVVILNTFLYEFTYEGSHTSSRAWARLHRGLSDQVLAYCRLTLKQEEIVALLMGHFFGNICTTCPFFNSIHIEINTIRFLALFWTLKTLWILQFELSLAKSNAFLKLITVFEKCLKY